jgi:thiol-disulfide isomerase/thioredoxin
LRLRALCVLIAVLCVCTACGEHSDTDLRVGALFPQLAVVSLATGERVDLHEHRGKALLINIWATWCEPCRREMPALEKLAAAVPGVEVLGVTVDSDLNLAREFVLRNQLTFARYADPDMTNARSLLHAGTLPVTYLVSADGRLLARYTGAKEWEADAVKRELQAALR